MDYFVKQVMTKIKFILKEGTVCYTIFCKMPFVERVESISLQNNCFFNGGET